MNKTTRNLLDIIFYVVIFLLIQFAVTYAIAAIGMWLGGETWSSVVTHFRQRNLELNSKMLVLISVLGSVLTMLLFVTRRWASFAREWLRTRPWVILMWVVFLALGSILPSEWLIEQQQVNMSEAMQEMFEKIMGEPTGYLAIGILAPLAEELVFRGAILRTLLNVFGRKWHWAAIIVSALIFGALHLNLVQFTHATLIGLLIGWMYYRTDSVIPGIVFHWVNNTVAYVMFNLMPQMADGKLIDLFHGDDRLMWMGLVCSLCIFLPSLFQLGIRLHPTKK